MRAITGAFPLVLLFTGCATSPDGIVRYYGARATTVVTVTQTVDCSADKKRLLVVNTPTAVTSYSSDLQRPFELDLRALRTTFADTTLTVEWYGDGRLKSINHSATGQGEAIVKAALALAAAAPIGGAAAAPPADCQRLTQLTGEKSATIVYEAQIDHGRSDQQRVELQPLTASRAAHQWLAAQLPSLVAVAGPQQVASEPQVQLPADAGNGVVTLRLPAMAVSPLELQVAGQTQWRGNVRVPGKETLAIAVPRPRPFGKLTFALAVAESGAIEKLSYDATSGTAAALNSLTGLSGLRTSSDKAETEAIKAEADLIAARQRLAACQAKPEDCK